MNKNETNKPCRIYESPAMDVITMSQSGPLASSASESVGASLEDFSSEDESIYNDWSF